MQTFQRSDNRHKRLGKSVDQQILQTIVGGFDEKTVRTKLIQMVLSEPGAVGVCFLCKDVQDQWSPSIDKPSAGRLPDSQEFAEAFSEKCDGYVTSPNLQTELIPSIKLHGLFAPIRHRSGSTEILLATAQQAETPAIAKTLQKIVSAFELWINSQNTADSNWQVLALGAIVDLVARIENQPTQKAAAEEAANSLAKRIGCSAAAIGLVMKGRMHLQAISGVSKIDYGSDSSQNLLQTFVECQTRNEAARYPAIDAANNHLLQAHKQLAAALQSESVFSQPLATEDDEIVGALVIVGPKQLLNSSQVARFCDTAGPAIASALRVVSKTNQSFVTRAFTYFRTKLSTTKRILALATLPILSLFMLLPITYRVRCSCVTEPVTRRFAVAPFDGQIVVGHREAGDFVRAGDVLAEMDGRTIRWELSGVTAERGQSLRTREMELSTRNVPKTILAELEYDRLVSEEAVLQYKHDHLRIKSPIDGVVLSGSLERAEAASVETGQVLFEVGPLKPMRLEIAIPSNEIAQVQAGYPVKAWIDGQEDKPIEGNIQKIHPRSETRDAQTVFIAEVEFPNEEEQLRPGMKGTVRLDCEKRSLGWSLFHKPMNWIRARLTWW